MIIRWLSRWTTNRCSQLCRSLCQWPPQDYNATATLESLSRAATCFIFPSFFLFSHLLSLKNKNLLQDTIYSIFGSFFVGGSSLLDTLCGSPERLLYISGLIPVYSLSYTSSHMVFLVLHVKICLSIFLSSFKRDKTIKAEGDGTNTHKPPSWKNTYYSQSWLG